jgi:hypothetical protein
LSSNCTLPIDFSFLMLTNECKTGEYDAGGEGALGEIEMSEMS